MRGPLRYIADLVEEAIYTDPPPDLLAYCRENYRPYYHLMHLLASAVGHWLPWGLCVELGVVFQDSSHHAEPSRLEWQYYQSMLAPGAVWVCDDVTGAFRMPDEPRGMVDYFEALPGQKLTFPGLHKGNVIGVVLT